MFAMRYGHKHIDARTAAYTLDPSGPHPPSPAAVVAVMVHDEYMRITNLRIKKTVKKRRIASPSAPEEVAEAPETLEAADEPLVGPQDEIERIELAEDQELDEDIEDLSAPHCRKAWRRRRAARGRDGT